MSLEPDASRHVYEGRLLGHVHLGMRLIESLGTGMSAEQNAELLHCVDTWEEGR